MNSFNRTDLLKTIDAFEGKEMIGLGDVMLDHFGRGSVSRISPEAAVPGVNEA